MPGGAAAHPDGPAVGDVAAVPSDLLRAGPVVDRRSSA